MKIPISWLSDYTNIDVSPKEFGDLMTMSGSKVEGISYMAEGIENVVTGRIVSIDNHPDADSLVVCKVDTGNTVIQIVTGADNIKEGDVIPVALEGALLPGGVKIKKGKLRGVESFGMLCSIAELGLTQSDCPEAVEDGIYILDDSTPLGKDIREVVGIDEYVVEFEITSNRPDCLSAIGLGREAAVTLNKPFAIKKPQISKNEGKAGEIFSIEVEEIELCPRYTAKIVKNVKIKPSPLWMRRRLKACGVRPINNIVDITNYVMLEFSQPLHAFDMRFLEGNRIVVRKAGHEKTFVTLDGQERALHPDMLMICDGKKPVAVAGVMGGENTEVLDTTTDVLFESANFDSLSVRKTAKDLGIRTESSGRFEKGLDPEMTALAVERACELVREFGAGEVVDGIIDIDHSKRKPVKILLRPEQMNAFLGTKIAKEFMSDVLEKLGFEFDGEFVIPPSFRADIETEADIAEEIARFYGYEKIPSTLMKGESLVGIKNFEQKIQDNIRDILVGQGLCEAVTYSFASPVEYDKLGFEKNSFLRNAVVITNPLGEDSSLMRTTTMGAMLEVLSRNYNHRTEQAALFEIGTVYLPKEGSLPDEKKKITLGMYGKTDFYDVKGIVEELLDSLNIISYQFEAEKNWPSFHAGRCAKILSGEEQIGVLGEVHPAVLDNYEIGTKAYIAVLDFETVLGLIKTDKTYKHLPKFPVVDRDIAVLADADIPVGKMEEAIRKYAGKMLESVHLFDIYEGKQVPEGKKSVAYSMKLRSAEKTLTDEETGKIFHKVVCGLEREFGATLR